MRNARNIILTLLFLSISCSSADVVRLFRNVNLEKKGIHVRLAYVPRGMYEKPFMIKFDHLLNSISDGSVIINAYNIYTVGNYDKVSTLHTESVTNFIDPLSQFKDSWFGVYIIVDDELAAGRRFILKNPHGMPGDADNLKDESLLLLPALDQKIIVWSTHENQKNYSWNRFNNEFRFAVKEGIRVKSEFITDPLGRSWRKLTGDFDTTAALTDTGLTRMGCFSSIRSYVGLPSNAVYKMVTPWHSVVIKGTIVARYFPCHTTPFWAVVYYNGSAFTTKNGKSVDNWKHGDLKEKLEKMFTELEIGCSDE